MNTKDKKKYEELLTSQAFNKWFDYRFGKRIGQMIGRNILATGNGVKDKNGNIKKYGGSKDV